MKIRTALLLLAAPLALAMPAAHAQECYGVGVILCDPSVSAGGVTVYEKSTPVCAGSCTYVNVPAVRRQGALNVCVNSYDMYGNYTGFCAPE